MTILISHAALANQSATEVLHDIYNSCVRHFSVTCVKPKALHWLSEVSQSHQIKVTEDLLIVRKDTFAGTESERGLSEDVYDQFEDFLQTHDLVMKAPEILRARSFQPDDINVPLAATGRSSKLIKKVILPFLLGLKFKTAVVVPITLALIALKTWKALTLGLLSLVLTGALFIFKLTKPKVVNYEVIHYPQYVEHHVEHPPTTGWDHPGYGRELDGNDLAYNGYFQ
ncbi:hypothetical protein NQ318_017227 [Aromia moschata]|uniref:Osiris 18 n=1 Tax=Aromia moschata TaxID=1265417 RepID=A0AAV8YLU8_9CUCU|nr:hypothetical protein NQ318_017227 [Aromia moschata]